MNRWSVTRARRSVNQCGLVTSVASRISSGVIKSLSHVSADMSAPNHGSARSLSSTTWMALLRVDSQHRIKTSTCRSEERSFGVSGRTSRPIQQTGILQEDQPFSGAGKKEKKKKGKLEVGTWWRGTSRMRSTSSTLTPSGCANRRIAGSAMLRMAALSASCSPEAFRATDRSMISVSAT